MASNLYYNNQNQLVAEGDPTTAYYKPNVASLQYADQGRTIDVPNDILQKYQSLISAGDTGTALKNIYTDYRNQLGGDSIVFGQGYAGRPQGLTGQEQQALTTLGLAQDPNSLAYSTLSNALKGIPFDQTKNSALYVDPNAPKTTQSTQTQTQQTTQPQQNTPTTTTAPNTSTPTLPQGNLTTGSIVDYLNSIGQNSSFASRSALAQQNGIQGYTGSAAQNTQLLGALRSARQTSSASQTQQFQQPASGPGSAAETNRLLGYNAFDPNTGASTGTPAPQNNPANTGTPATPTTATGQTATQNIIQTWSDVSKQLGISDIQSQYTKTVDESKALQDKKDTQALEINNNPWYSEGKRQMELKKLDTAYETKLNTLSNYAKLYDAQYQEAVATAKFLTTGIQDDQQFALELARKKQEAVDALLKDSTKLQAGIVGEYQYATQQGYTGSFSQYQNEDTNRKALVAKAGVATPLPTGQDVTTKETSDALNTANSISSILSSPAFNTAFGITGLVKTSIPNTPEYTLGAQVQQIKDKLSLAARGQLKGQGQVSNYEGLMLANAQTALRTGMSPTDARQELINIQGALTTSTGGSAKVELQQGNSVLGVRMLTSREITQALADGLKVRYVQ